MSKRNIGLIATCLGGLLTIFSIQQPKGSNIALGAIIIGALLAFYGLYLTFTSRKKKEEN
jgi:uncharacterized membrane protein